VVGEVVTANPVMLAVVVVVLLVILAHQAARLREVIRTEGVMVLLLAQARTTAQAVVAVLARVRLVRMELPRLAVTVEPV
jgi:hypothetical protein